jgi:hypothetical protein
MDKRGKRRGDSGVVLAVRRGGGCNVMEVIIYLKVKDRVICIVHLGSFFLIKTYI